MVASSLSQNSPIQVRSSLLPQNTQYLNRAPQVLSVNKAAIRSAGSKEAKVFPRLCHAVGENSSVNSIGVVSKNNSPIIVIDNYDSFTYNLCQVPLILYSIC